MRKSLLVLGVLLILVGAVPAAQAAGPPIENLAPSSGAFLPLGTALSSIRFTCPEFAGNLFASQIVPPYRGYEWRISTAPTTESEGLLNFENLYTLGDALNTGENECEAYGETQVANILPRGTYFFQAYRRGVGTYEPGPVTEFSVGLPKTLPGKVKVFLGCGLTKTTKQAGSCKQDEKIGAFYRSSKNSIYEVCARFPSSKELCSEDQEAKAGQLYVNKVTVTEPGPVVVTWKVLRGPTLMRGIVRKRN
jgi:hypothetical protein